MRIDYELAKEIGATHYHNRTGEMYKVDLGSLLVFRRDDWVNSGLPLGEAVSKVEPIPQKRTRTECEKVTESIFDLRDEFERGELYESLCGSKLENEHDFIYAYTHDHLVRKVEKEIDWRVDADSYFLKTKHLGIDCTIEEAITRSDYCDEFLELCRVALRANGEVE